MVKPRKRWLFPEMAEKLLTGTLSLSKGLILGFSSLLDENLNQRDVSIHIYFSCWLGFKPSIH